MQNLNSSALVTHVVRAYKASLVLPWFILAFASYQCFSLKKKSSDTGAPHFLTHIYVHAIIFGDIAFLGQTCENTEHATAVWILVFIHHNNKKKPEKWRCALPIQFCVFSNCIPHDVENKALFLEEKTISFRNRKDNLRKVIGHEHIPNEIQSKAPHPPKKKNKKKEKYWHCWSERA